ncbi:MAG: hypothetical protein JSV88_05195, partial [Candidatus Aminicenantes bacterium]
MEYFLEEPIGITQWIIGRKKGPDFFLKRGVAPPTHSRSARWSSFRSVISNACSFCKLLQDISKGIKEINTRFRVILLLTILTAVILPENVFAQKDNIRFERLSLEHGLSSVSVYCILQDSQGFMWFGTEDGLNKYDGYNFTVYRHNPDNSASLGNDYVTSIFEDSDGSLWIGTRGGGLNQLDRKKEIFTRFQNQADNPHSLSNNVVTWIFADSGGSLWIGTRGGGLNRFHRKKEKFTRFQNQADNPHSLSNNVV